jgi:choline-sulfatase
MPPNILWICTDQQRADTLGCYGNAHVNTPRLDQLAARGVQFEHCYCQSPVCTPSRASMLTGRYPRTTRCRQNGQALPAREVPVPRRLADAGYTCGLAGKLHLAPCHPDKDEGHPMREERIDDGYAVFHWSHDTDDVWLTNAYHTWLRRQGVTYERYPVEDSAYVTTSVPAEHHQTTWCAERTIDFIEAHEAAETPWLFSMNPFDPHHPFDPPPEYLERYLDRLGALPLPTHTPGELDEKPIFQRIDHRGAYNTEGEFPFPKMDDRDHRLVRAAYWAMCDLIDAQVGRVLDALDRTGQRDDTIVVFTSDHGEMLGDHGLYLKGPYFYDPAIRVPLLMHWPGRVEGGTSVDTLTELGDLAPTLLDLAGVDPPPGMQARSFAPVLTGEPTVHRESVYCEYYNAMPWHEDSARPFATMIRTESAKLVRMHGLDTGELYDLSADPAETTNRWDDPALQDTRASLLARLSDRMAETVDPRPERTAPW